MPAPVAGPIITPDNPLWTAPTQNLSLEQDALRWRELSRRLTAIEQALGTTVRYNTIAAPGGAELIAQVIRDVGNQVRFDAGARQITVRDSANTIRAQMGDLAANGNSPAQFGFRANDASGTPIFDSLGLIAVMKVLGSVLNVSQQSVTGNGGWQTVSGSTVSFTLSRATNVLTLAAATVLDPTVGDTGFNLQASVLVDGSPTGPVFAPGTSSFPCTPFAFNSFAAGGHNVAFGVNQTNTKLWSAIGVYVFAFQLGA